MISRTSTLIIAETCIEWCPSSPKASALRPDRIDTQWLYNFLFANNFPSYFCNQAKVTFTGHDLKQLILQLHTGENYSMYFQFFDWTHEDRVEDGQRLLTKLAESLLRYFGKKDFFWQLRNGDLRSNLVQTLRKDGYDYIQGKVVYTG